MGTLPLLLNKVQLRNMNNQFDHILFDLDATLYPESNGLWKVIRHRISLYMSEHLDIPKDRIESLREEYYLSYGTTLKGLQAHYEINSAEYLDYVHDVPLQDFIQPDQKLRNMILSIPQPCWIFTNSDTAHTRRVLTALDIEDCFEGIIDILSLSPYCKPQYEAYKLALNYANIKYPNTCVFLDDSPSNLAPAREMGIFTVLVGNNGSHPSANRCIESVHELIKILPEIWQ